MISCIDSVKTELEESIRMRENIDRRLEKLKEFDGWYLNYSVVKGHSYYQMINSEGNDKKGINKSNKDNADNGQSILNERSLNKTETREKPKRKHNRKYLGKSTNPKVGKLQEHRLLTEARQICDANINSMDALVATYKEVNPDEIIKNLGVAYQECAGFSDEVLGIPTASEWKRQGMAKRDSIPRFKPENLIHTADNGEKMRTRAEVLYANMLDSLGVEYIYELPMDINGQRKIPDFTILHPKTKQEIIIEYMGMYGDENYRIRNTIKIAEYFDAGYILGKNLFVFMDGEEGHFDSNILRKVLQAVIS